MATNDSSKASEAPSVPLPPEMEKHQITSVDELLTSLNRIPLFMTEIDETDGAGGENTELEALKALAYEGTRLEVATNFREQGNECARAKQWSDAREFYSKALSALSGHFQSEEEPEIDLGVGGPSSEPGKIVGELNDEDDLELDRSEEERKEKAIEEACYVNRALCNLELSTSNAMPVSNFGLINIRKLRFM